MVHSPCRVIPKAFKKCIASLFGPRHLWEVVENKPASLLMVSLS